MNPEPAATPVSFEVPGVEQQDVLVLKDCKFPYYSEEFISKNLVIGIVSSGSSRGYYDKQPVSVGTNTVSVILPNHICLEQETSDDYRITLVIFSPRFMEEIVAKTVHRNYIKYHYEPNTQLTTGQCRSLLRIAEGLEEVSKLTDMPNRHEMLINLADVFLTMMSYYRTEQDAAAGWVSHGHEIYNKFCDLLVKHYREYRDVQFYATQLHLTSKHFSKVVFLTTGHTASYWIEQHIAVQAQHLLRNRRDMSVQEVGYFLGFDELAHFSRYFKRVVGVSPRQYRNEAWEEQ